MTRNPDVPLRIAICTPAWPGEGVPNGIVTYCAMMRPALGAMGVETFIIAGTVAEGPARSDASVIEVQAPRPGLLRRAGLSIVERFRPGARQASRIGRFLAGRLRRLSREQGVALVEMEESFGIAGWVQGRTPVKVVVRLHGPWFLNGAWHDMGPAARARIRREGQGIRRADGVTAPSRDVLERTARYYRLSLDGGAVIPNPMPVAPPEHRWRRAGCDPSTVLFVGRFDNHKGGDVMLEAFARVAAARPDAVLLFAGPHLGVVDAGGRRWEYTEFLARAVPDAAARERVRALGVLGPDAIRRLRQTAAVTVVASRYENFAYALLECASQGCPIVATAVGGSTEIVQDGRNGLLARPEDPGDLARAILTILDDQDLGERLAARALADCAERYDPATIARQTLEYYERVLARG